MKKEVMILTGAVQIGIAIARRLGADKKIVVGDKNRDNAENVAHIMTQAGFDIEAMQIDLSVRQSIREMIARAQTCGNIAMMVNAAGVSPNQASIETILKVDLYGAAVLLEEVGKVIKPGGTGITISSQSGHRLPALTPAEDEQLATTPTEKLLDLDILQPEKIRDTCMPTSWQNAATPSASYPDAAHSNPAQPQPRKAARAPSRALPPSFAPAPSGCPSAPQASLSLPEKRKRNQRFPKR